MKHVPSNGELGKLVGKNIKRIRKSQGMTLQYLGVLTGLRFSTCSAYERATKPRSNMTLDVLRRIADGLQVEPCILLMERESLESAVFDPGDRHGYAVVAVPKEWIGDIAIITRKRQGGTS